MPAGDPASSRTRDNRDPPSASVDKAENWPASAFAVITRLDHRHALATIGEYEAGRLPASLHPYLKGIVVMGVRSAAGAFVLASLTGCFSGGLAGLAPSTKI